MWPSRTNDARIDAASARPAGSPGSRVAGGSGTARIALPASLPEGRYWPYVVVTGPSGSTVEYAASPVHLTR